MQSAQFLKEIIYKIMLTIMLEQLLVHTPANNEIDLIYNLTNHDRIDRQ